VEAYCTQRGYGIVRQYCGHGIGHEMHEDPEVPNYGRPGHGIRLMPGMTFCIEPMINQKGDGVRQLQDGWTVVTANGSLSAHFEHQIAITKDGPVIMTRT
jgi:methionyl aminopeptidase